MCPLRQITGKKSRIGAGGQNQRLAADAGVAQQIANPDSANESWMTWTMRRPWSLTAETGTAGTVPSSLASCTFRQTKILRAGMRNPAQT